MIEKNNHFDVAVIGSGPGGYAAAFRAADLDKRVVLIEKDDVLGGVCLNRGCIPSKALLYISQIIEEARALERKGIKFNSPKIELDKVRNWKNEVVEKLNKGIAQMAKSREVQVFTGVAEFKSKNEIAITSKDKSEVISFDSAIIATGSRSTLIPSVPNNHPSVMTSKEALLLESIPKTLLVIGGGYIGLEMATVYNSLGSQVTVVEMLDSLLPGADKDIVRLLQHKLKNNFHQIMVKSKVVEVKPNNDKTLTVKIDNNGKIINQKFDKVLVSVGRRPNTENLGLEKIGVQLTEQGFIKVDEKQKTNVLNIYAIGDVAGEPMLAHKATYEGKIAAEVIAGLPAVFDAKSIPAVIFTNPEIAWTGLTETEAQAKKISYKKAEFPWGASGKAIATGQSIGKTKLLFNPENGKLLGVSIVGAHAGDIISEGALAIEMGADAEDIGLTIHPHPTLSETFANAAEVFSGTVTDLYIPKTIK
ncbi:dihydrolipoyl dehydrogenase [bacterium]|nr:dihydrolipoyl dehydrogenase [bacterium]